LVDPGGIARPRRLEHCRANLFQLPADGLRGLARRLKLRFAMRYLRRLAATFLSGQEHTSRYRRCRCKT
jgi:hypothetical protein